VVFFIDLNGMKAINDTFGHDAGDAALSETAQLLTRAFRESDIIARLGGDEFAIFAADCDADGAAIMRERIEQNVEASNQAARVHAFSLSVSVGTASFDPFAPVELDTLLEAADQAMYEQKRARADSGTLARVRTGSGARQIG
jgi:diguanylate cyclase (GGDEF)-like protein